jgi:hypothetical protein
MKGLVFTEFLELVEERFGVEVADRVITAAGLPNDGAYTAIGTYDHGELVRLVISLSRASGTDVPALVAAFGEHLFERLVASHPALMEEVRDAFSVFERLHGVIHTEVLKLYPAAELPEFECTRLTADRLVLEYHSPRGFADLAEGLIRGCAAHFGEPIAVEREDLSGGRGTDVRFSIRRAAA